MLGSLQLRAWDDTYPHYAVAATEDVVCEASNAPVADDTACHGAAAGTDQKCVASSGPMQADSFHNGEDVCSTDAKLGGGHDTSREAVQRTQAVA